MANKSGKPSGKPDATKLYQFAIAMGMDDAAANAFVQKQMSSTASDPNDPEVYWAATPPGGQYYDAVGPHRRENEYPYDAKKPETKKASDANYWLQQQFEQQTPAWTRVVKEMQDAGLISPGADLASIMGQWEKAVALSAASTPHGAKLSPEDYIRLQGTLNGGGVGGTHTVISTSIDRTPRADMIGNAQTQAQSDLGRRLSPAEAAARADSLSALESKNPRTTTTTSVTDALNNVRSSSSVTQGGIGAAGMQEQLTQQDMAAKDYGAYQAAGRYFPVMMNALAAINQAGA